MSADAVSILILVILIALAITWGVYQYCARRKSEAALLEEQRNANIEKIKQEAHALGEAELKRQLDDSLRKINGE